MSAARERSAVLIQMYEQHGAAGLSQTLRTIREAYDGDPAAFASAVIAGVAAAVVDTVNHGARGKARLPGWWTAS